MPKIKRTARLKIRLRGLKQAAHRLCNYLIPQTAHHSDYHRIVHIMIFQCAVQMSPSLIGKRAERSSRASGTRVLRYRYQMYVVFILLVASAIFTIELLHDFGW